VMTVELAVKASIAKDCTLRSARSEILFKTMSSPSLSLRSIL
jgi:hypothetical protein